MALEDDLFRLRAAVARLEARLAVLEELLAPELKARAAKAAKASTSSTSNIKEP